MKCAARLSTLFASLALVASAQNAPKSDSLDALLRDSPFIPAGGGGRAATAAGGGPLELRGVVFENGSYSFSVYDQQTRESVWVKLQQDGLPFTVRSFNRERDELTVDVQGRSMVLPLQEARTQAGQDAVGPTGPTPLPGPANSLPGQTNPMSPGQPPAAPVQNAGQPQGNVEAQRLQNLADEIRRRRDMRNTTIPNVPKN